MLSQGKKDYQLKSVIDFNNNMLQFTEKLINFVIINLTLFYMMIQRMQSLYLLAAAIMMGFFCNSTIGTYQAEEAISQIRPLDYPVFLIVNIVIAVLLFIAIFLYKNTRRQKTVTLVSMLLIAASSASGGFIIYSGHEGAAIELTGGLILLIGALILTLGAYRGIRHDEKLLRDSDRIR